MLTKLIPFTISTVLYFYTLPSVPSLQTLFIKCLPILCLAGAVHLQGKSNFNKLIICGLLSSSVGDACLVYKDLFPLGMVAFAIAHCFYIKAFGFKPLKPGIAVGLLALAAIMLFQILPNINDKIIFFGIPVYCTFLTTMSWRALARASDGLDAWSWSKALTGIGSILFVFSDTVICFHDLQKPIPYGRIIIMSTYYIAQLGIALSVKSESQTARDTIKKN